MIPVIPSSATVSLLLAAPVIAVLVVVAGGVTAISLRSRRRPPAPPASETPAAPGAKTPPEPSKAPVPPPAATPTSPVRSTPTVPETATPTPPAPVRSTPTPAETVRSTPTPAETVAPPEPEAARPTFRGRLGKARGLLAGYLGAVRSGDRIDATTWDELEEALIRADVGVRSTDALLGMLRGRVKAGEISSAGGLVDALQASLVEILASPAAGLAPVGPGTASGEPGPDRTVDVWMFVGVNGVGKTTTVGKVATRLTRQGARVTLAAADTFRAAAAEQLTTWASRAGADIVRGNEGGDPSAVVFDAVQRAGARGHDVVLADTAGRLHNKVNLVEELKKVRRIADRPPGRVTEVLLVLDATTGQNGLAQAKVFSEAVEVSGVVLTKLDGTAKGGIVVAIQRELGVPVKLVGLGEGAEDLVDFQPEAFVEALFDPAG